MSELPWYHWILSRGLLDLVLIRSIWKLDDTNTIAHKNSDGIREVSDGIQKVSDGIQKVSDGIQAVDTEVNAKLDVVIALLQKMEMENTLEKSDVTDLAGDESSPSFAKEVVLDSSDELEEDGSSEGTTPPSSRND